MDISHTSRSAESATAEKKRNVALSSFAGGLSAWLGGVAFCVGFGVTAPGWVALVVTVLAVAATNVSRALVRRNARIADPPARL
jgi:membrane protein implicated in regulation of membrane protease activity